MTPMERLLAEELPTGTFGGPRHRDPEPAPQQQPARSRRETTAQEAATNRARLEAALERREDRGTSRAARHLRPVPDHQTAA